MKRFLTVMLAGLLVLAVIAPALAWEFAMKGEYENRLRYFGRMGDDDLFGKASYQDAGAGTFIGFAGPNIYGTGNIAPVVADMSGGAGAPPLQSPAMVITRGGFSRWGSDAFYNDSKLTIQPEIRINQAIRVHGVYNIGGMRNKYRQTGTNVFGDGVGAAPLERYYMSQSSMNAYDGTFGTWEQFRATMQTPWCIFSIGLKDFPLGTGATLGYNTRAEAFLAVVPYGPLRFLYGIWLARGRFLESWQTVPDADTKNNFFQGAIFTYDMGSFSAGGAAIYRHMHQKTGALPSPANYSAGTGSAAPYNPGAAAVGPQQARDDSTFIGLAFLKYFNGKFFANAEYAWITVDRHYPISGLQVAGIAAANMGGRSLNLEGYHWFSEIGVLSGPTKVALMYGLVSGRVLNNGNARKVYTAWTMNNQAMEPYEFLMFNTYAGGNNGGWGGLDVTFAADDHGQMSDAYCFAGRADYAVASNLNIWGSYIWAHRLERAGFLNGGVRDIGDGAAGGVAPGTLLNAYGGVTPYCPDGYLGWEAGAGVDWKLLEGLNLKVRYAYWQPGDWFDYAYQALPGPIGAGQGNWYLMKGRSPINAIEGKMVVEF